LLQRGYVYLDTRLFTASLSYPRIISEVCPVDASSNLRLAVLLANSSLDCWSLSDSVDPLQQMREFVHFFLLESSPLPSLDPWPDIRLVLGFSSFGVYDSPCLHVSDTVLALSRASEVLLWLPRVLAAEVDLKDTIDT